MRNKLWMLTLSKTEEGCNLPWWAVTIRAILFPLDSFYWWMSSSRGYQWQNNTWKIHGVTYSEAALLTLAEAQREVYRISRKGDVVTIEEVES